MPTIVTIVNEITGERTTCEIKEGATFNGMYKLGCDMCAGFSYYGRDPGNDNTCVKCQGTGIHPDQSAYSSFD